MTRIAILVREWERKNLPYANSGLALELFLVVSHNTLLGNAITLKVLFRSIEYSETGVRKQLRRLIADGWVSLRISSKDRRVKHVVAESKMLLLVEAYSKILKGAYLRSAPPGLTPIRNQTHHAHWD